MVISALISLCICVDCGDSDLFCWRLWTCQIGATDSLCPPSWWCWMFSGCRVPVRSWVQHHLRSHYYSSKVWGLILRHYMGFKSTKVIKCMCEYLYPNDEEDFVAEGCNCVVAGASLWTEGSSVSSQLQAARPQTKQSACSDQACLTKFT